MMNIKWICASFVLVLSQAALATFVPQDQLRHDWMLMANGTMTEKEFVDTVAAVNKVYAPVVAAFGARLNMKADWADTTPNAFAQQSGSTWNVTIQGGLGRRAELTLDGLTLVACHELGHHLGGFPFVPGGFFQKAWAANEGQADYFASHVCARRMWGSQLETNATFASKVDVLAKQQCDQVWTTVEDQNLCYRITVGGQSIANTLAALTSKPMPAFTTPDTHVVSKTDDNHPVAQCRLDTALQAALCKADFDDKLIPGKSVSAGVTSTDAEREAADKNCTNYSHYAIGLRPTCWYKPRM